MKKPSSAPQSEKVKDAPLGSHRVRVNGNNGDKSELTSGNHAFYVGKYIPKGIGQRTAEFVSGNYKDRIYSEDFYLAMLETAFAETKEGEDIKVVIAPQFSEIFNGQRDIKNAMTVDQQKTFIQRLAKRRFGRENVVVESMEDQELHQPLFQALRSAVDPETDQVDVKKAYGGNDSFELSDKPDSLEIARYLYAAQKEYETLGVVFKHAIPGQLREDMDEDSPMQYYALTEVAVRLSDILNGCTVQGGVERQEVYDHIIEKIIRGKKGSYKKSPQMKRLFEVMDGKCFETIHIPTKENPYTEKRRSFAKKMRLAVALTLGLGAVGVAFYEGTKHAEEERQRIEELVNGSLEDRLSGQTFYMDGKWEIPREHNVETFKGVIRSCMRDMEERYGIGIGYHPKLEPLLQEYLLEHERPNSMYNNGFNRFDAVDRFIKKHALYLHSLGLETGVPYAELAKHTEIFKQALKSDDQTTYSYEVRKPTMIGPVGRIIDDENKYPEELTYLGSFQSGHGFNGDYEFFVLKKDGKEILVARDEWVQPFDDNRRDFTAERAREGVMQYFYAMQRYSTIELSMQDDHLRDMDNWESISIQSPCKGKEEEARDVEANEGYLYPERGSFEDFFERRFHYEYVIGVAFDTKRGTKADCLMARTEGDTHYTYERAVEMGVEYERIRDRWYDYYSRKYYEAKIPMDLEAISAESSAIVSDMSGLWSQVLEEGCATEEMSRKYESIVLYQREDVQELVTSHDFSYEATKALSDRMETIRESEKELRDDIEENCPLLSSVE